MRRDPPDAPHPFAERVRAVVAATTPGQVLTYGEVAAEAGRPGAARAVGGVLRRSSSLPWWRVVTVAGRLVPGNEDEHARRLRAEGVEVRDGRVVPTRGPAPVADAQPRSRTSARASSACRSMSVSEAMEPTTRSCGSST